MGKAKKAKNAKMSQDRLNLKARAAAGAAATAGRARTFADKTDKLAKAGADPEIAEGLEEYEEKKVNKYIKAAEDHCGEKRVFNEDMAEDYCKEHGLLEFAKATPLNILIRLTEKVERANNIQHSGGRLAKEDWAELYSLTNEARGVIEDAKNHD